MLLRETAGLALERVLPPLRGAAVKGRSVKRTGPAGGIAGRAGGRRGLAGHR
jgi:hypothetical protein